MRHFVEHLPCDVYFAAFSVHIDEGASNEHVKVVGAFKGEGVEGVGGGEGREGGAGLCSCGEGVVVGKEAVAEHATEEAEGEVG